MNRMFLPKWMWVSFGILFVCISIVITIVFISSNTAPEPIARLNKNVVIIVDNHNYTVSTNAQTVKEVLDEHNIALSSADRVVPATGNSIEDQMKIQIIRYFAKTTEEYQRIPFRTVYYNDPNIEIGKQSIVQEGIPGQIKIIKSVTVENGTNVQEKTLSKQIVSHYRTKVIAIGSKARVQEKRYLVYEPRQASQPVASEKPQVTVKEVTEEVADFDHAFQYKIDDTTLTAYTAGVESTGKSTGDEGYGVTASGAMVKEGETIAVDPTIIPMGWWVYITGIGYRKAEDTGSAIKGNKIDVYVEDLAVARSFGKKENIAVYVIGPNDPR